MQSFCKKFSMGRPFSRCISIPIPLESGQSGSSRLICSKNGNYFGETEYYGLFLDLFTVFLLPKVFWGLAWTLMSKTKKKITLRQPDRPIHKFKASKSRDQRTLCTSELSIDGFYDTQTVNKLAETVSLSLYGTFFFLNSPSCSWLNISQ